MPFLPGLAVVYVGIVGGDTNHVDQQVQLLLAEQAVKATPTPAAVVHKLATHGDGSRELVRKLHVDGLVGGELVANRGHLTLRLVIYDGDGGLRSLSEIPLDGRRLTRTELAVLNTNLADEVAALEARHAAHKPARPSEARAPTPAVRRAKS